ncbi:putative pre-rrna processing protein [Phaeomoniella chlamydospora]|uniref:Putative pre-rrna processing protein n=1 Tax=Phaeomoniella chlamydospora TaxID=158046 RepID=A0A0G2DYD4_PHACM|nr:putative pre-rrna processing protein [Phaeomoniella chlamydospora]
MSSKLQQKASGNGGQHSPKAATKAALDPRFAGIQNDPRYRLPSKRKLKVKVDKRFSGMLKDEDFTRKAKVDRYGRPLQDDSEKTRLKRKYEFEDGDDVKPDDDDDVQAELARVGKEYDPIRDGGYSLSSDDSSSDEDDEVDEDTDDLDQAAQAVGVPLGEATSRIAVVNLDWDHIRAEDLMATFSSFVPQGGRLQKVVVYPSEFGKERMEREEMEGPPRELFISKKMNGKAQEDVDDDSLGEEDDEAAIKDSIIQPDAGEEFDSAKLRKYQLERLRYFYAILEFSSIEVAKTVYDAIDGTEYLSTANFFDLRFVPDDTDFSSDKPRDECDRILDGYKPNEFVTDALQHSKVKLTWDADDIVRKEAQAKAFRGGRKEIDENDLKAYLGSDSSDSEEDSVEDNAETQPNSKLSKKEKEKQRLRALLGLSDKPASKSKPDGPVGGVQITFSSGLIGEKSSSVFANDPEPDETTVEKYVRKERERKQRRKGKGKTSAEGADDATGQEDHRSLPEREQVQQEQDLGFDDPFFTEPINSQASTAALRKAERKKRREEREAEEKATAAKRAELELLMIDDKESNMKHFDMKEIERAEKKKNKKKQKGKKSKNIDYDEADRDQQEQNDAFQMDVSDPRFARLYENHEFAIDPTNPKFKGTEGMKALLDEGRKRRKLAVGTDDEGERTSKKKDRKKGEKEKGDDVDVASGDVGENLSKLIQKVKARNR